MRNKMNLGSLSVVLVFTGKVFAFKTVKNLGDGLGWSGQHRLQWHTWLQLARIAQLPDTILEQRRDNDFIRREFATGYLAKIFHKSSFAHLLVDVLEYIFAFG